MSADDVRSAPIPLIAFSAEMAEQNRSLKAFLFHNMYRHYKVNRMASKAHRVVTDMFGLLMAEPNCLPAQWQRPSKDQSGQIDETQIRNQASAPCCRLYCRHDRPLCYD